MSAETQATVTLGSVPENPVTSRICDLNRRAETLAVKGDFGTAEAALREADALLAQPSDLADESHNSLSATTLHNWGCLSSRRQRFTEATRQLEACVVLEDAAGVESPVTWSNLSVARAGNNDAAGAHAAALRAVTAARAQSSPLLPLALLQLGRCSIALGKVQPDERKALGEGALSQLREAVSISSGATARRIRVALLRAQDEVQRNHWLAAQAVAASVQDKDDEKSSQQNPQHNAPGRGRGDRRVVQGPVPPLERQTQATSPLTARSTQPTRHGTTSNGAAPQTSRLSGGTIRRLPALPHGAGPDRESSPGTALSPPDQTSVHDLAAASNATDEEPSTGVRPAIPPIPIHPVHAEDEGVASSAVAPSVMSTVAGTSDDERVPALRRQLRDKARALETALKSVDGLKQKLAASVESEHTAQDTVAKLKRRIADLKRELDHERTAGQTKLEKIVAAHDDVIAAMAKDRDNAKAQLVSSKTSTADLQDLIKTLRTELSTASLQSLHREEGEARSLIEVAFLAAVLSARDEALENMRSVVLEKTAGLEEAQRETEALTAKALEQSEAAASELDVLAATAAGLVTERDAAAMKCDALTARLNHRSKRLASIIAERVLSNSARLVFHRWKHITAARKLTVTNQRRTILFAFSRWKLRAALASLQQRSSNVIVRCSFVKWMQWKNTRVVDLKQRKTVALTAASRKRHMLLRYQRWIVTAIRGPQLRNRSNAVVMTRAFCKWQTYDSGRSPFELAVWRIHGLLSALLVKAATLAVQSHRTVSSFALNAGALTPSASMGIASLPSQGTVREPSAALSPSASSVAFSKQNPQLSKRQWTPSLLGEAMSLDEALSAVLSNDAQMSHELRSAWAALEQCTKTDAENAVGPSTYVDGTTTRTKKPSGQGGMTNRRVRAPRDMDALVSAVAAVLQLLVARRDRLALPFDRLMFLSALSEEASGSINVAEVINGSGMLQKAFVAGDVDFAAALLAIPGVSYRDPSALLRDAVQSSTARIPLCRLLLKHGGAASSIALSRTSPVLSQLWTDLCLTLASDAMDPNRVQQQVKQGELDFARRKDLLVSIMQHDDIHVDQSAEDAGGMTIIARVCQAGDVELLRALIDVGALFDEPMRSGDAPLHVAVAACATEVVADLLGRNVRVERRGRNGLTPLAIAKLTSTPAIREMLERHIARLLPGHLRRYSIGAAHHSQSGGGGGLHQHGVEANPISLTGASFSGFGAEESDFSLNSKESPAMSTAHPPAVDSVSQGRPDQACHDAPVFESPHQTQRPAPVRTDSSVVHQPHGLHHGGMTLEDGTPLSPAQFVQFGGLERRDSLGGRRESFGRRRSRRASTMNQTAATILTTTCGDGENATQTDAMDRLDVLAQLQEKVPGSTFTLAPADYPNHTFVMHSDGSVVLSTSAASAFELRGLTEGYIQIVRAEPCEQRLCLGVSTAQQSFGVVEGRSADEESGGEISGGDCGDDAAATSAHRWEVALLDNDNVIFVVPGHEILMMEAIVRGDIGAVRVVPDQDASVLSEFVVRPHRQGSQASLVARTKAPPGECLAAARAAFPDHGTHKFAFATADHGAVWTHESKTGAIVLTPSTEAEKPKKQFFTVIVDDVSGLVTLALFAKPHLAIAFDEDVYAVALTKRPGFDGGLTQSASAISATLSPPAPNDASLSPRPSPAVAALAGRTPLDSEAAAPLLWQWEVLSRSDGAIVFASAERPDVLLCVDLFSQTLGVKRYAQSRGDAHFSVHRAKAVDDEEDDLF